MSKKTQSEFNGHRPVPTADQLQADLLDRQVPYSFEAERALLGSMMLRPDCIDDISAIVQVDDLYDPANALIFDFMKTLHDGGRRIDPMLIREQMKVENVLETVGGAAYLSQVFTQVPHAAHAVYYAQIVADRSVSRRLILAGTDIIKRAYDDIPNPDECLDFAESTVFVVRDRRGQVERIRPAVEISHDAIELLDRRIQGHEVDVSTGFPDVDKLLGGLHKGELIILAARPSMGKTALAMNIAESVSESQVCLFVSLEMSDTELITRLLCSRAQVSSHAMRNGSLTAEQRKSLIRAASELSQVRLLVDDTPARKVGDIAAAARRMKKKQLDLIVVDYLQLLEPDDPKQVRELQVATMAKKLKRLARELEIPVLCLAQLNRAVQDTKDKLPKLHHLRESGAIEQDADVVMFIHRYDYDKRGQEREQQYGKAKLFVEKQRNGPTGEIQLTWCAETTRFDSYYPDSPDDPDRRITGGVHDDPF